MSPKPLACTSVVSALTAPVEVTASSLIEEYEWQGRDVLDALSALNNVFASWELECEPALGTGGLDTVRVIRRPNADSAEIARREIATGESGTCEFKQTLALDTKRQKATGEPVTSCFSESVLTSSLKTVAAYLNTSGGSLYIGVTNAGEVIGVSVEYPLVCPKDQTFDGWELYFRSMIEKYFHNGRAISASVLVQRVIEGDKDIARVQVGTRSSLSFMKSGDHSKLYVRSGNRTLEVAPHEMEQYFKLEKLYI